jgi:hypothetical protein
LFLSRLKAATHKPHAARGTGFPFVGFRKSGVDGARTLANFKPIKCAGSKREVAGLKAAATKS